MLSIPGYHGKMETGVGRPRQGRIMTDETLENWPIVRIVGTEEEAQLIRGFLDNQDIPAQVESLLFHQEPVTFGALGEVRIRVPEEYEQQAFDALDDAEHGVDPRTVSDDQSSEEDAS